MRERLLGVACPLGANQVIHDRVDLIVTLSGRRAKEVARARRLGGECSSFGLGDDAKLGQIGFIRNERDGSVGTASRDELEKRARRIEAASIGFRVDDDERVVRSHLRFAMKRTRRVFFVETGRIENVQFDAFLGDVDLFRVRVFERRVVFAQETAADELDSQRRFADARFAENGDANGRFFARKARASFDFLNVLHCSENGL